MMLEVEDYLGRLCDLPCCTNACHAQFVAHAGHMSLGSAESSPSLALGETLPGNHHPLGTVLRGAPGLALNPLTLGEIDLQTHETAISTALAAIDECTVEPTSTSVSEQCIGQRLCVSGQETSGQCQSLLTDARLSEEEALGEASVSEDNLESLSDFNGLREHGMLIPEAEANPGSTGHPELCPRPCLYFPSGQCVNGTRCSFCHLPHPKRPAHLDKRHRAMLKEMPLSDCIALALPILKEKVQTISFNSDEAAEVVARQLDELGSSMSLPVPQLPRPRRSRETSALRTALKAMSLRSVLTTLHRAALPQSSPERAAIDALLEKLCCQSFGRHGSPTRDEIQ